MPPNTIAAVCARLPGAVITVAIMFGNAPRRAKNRSTNTIS